MGGGGWWWVVGGGGWYWWGDVGERLLSSRSIPCVATGDHGRPPGDHRRSLSPVRAQILAWCPESSPLPTAPEPLKLRSFGIVYIYIYIGIVIYNILMFVFLY